MTGELHNYIMYIYVANKFILPGGRALSRCQWFKFPHGFCMWSGTGCKRCLAPDADYSDPVGYKYS